VSIQKVLNKRVMDDLLEKCRRFYSSLGFLEIMIILTVLRAWQL